MSATVWKFGDRVVHSGKPEWGPGVITGAKQTTQDGDPCQSLTIRFERGGVRTLSTAFARLIAADLAGPLSAPESNGADEPWPPADNASLKERLLRLPEPATDPFSPLPSRLKATLDLFKFSAVAGSLLDWAVSQSGLADPMSKMNRHELEKVFEQFCAGRDQHLKKLVLELRKLDPTGLQRTLAAAPPAVQQALRRLDAMR